MKIIHINASYKPAYIYGGPTMSVSKLCEELIKARQPLELLTTTANGKNELDVRIGAMTLVEGVPVSYFRRLTKGNSHLSPSLVLALWNRLTTRKALAIVHIHAWWNMVSVLSSIVALLEGRPVLLSPRGTLSEYSFGNRTSFAKNLFHRLLGKSLLERCHFHVSTEKEKQDIFNLLTPKTITIIPNFVELPSFQPEDAQPSSPDDLSHPFRLLFLSRIEEKKGLDNLFQALSKLNLPYHLTIAGTGEPEYIALLKSLASELNVDGNIRWIGQQNKDEKFTVLAEHDLVVLPSHDESFANVVIESLAVGTPVLISSMVGLADYVLTNQLGWVSRNIAESIADTITNAYGDPEKRLLVRKNAPVKVREDFDSRHLLDLYITMYNHIAQHSSVGTKSADVKQRETV